MSEMEDKIGAILSNPQMMQQIMSMAQALGAQSPKEELQPQPSREPEMDLNMVRKFTDIAQKSGIDQRERALLSALQGYLTVERVNKLEKAMRAAKIAQLASCALGNGGLLSLLGR